MTTHGNGHPDFERWVEYREDKLSPSEMAELQGHLVACPRCTGLLLDLEDFLTPPDADPDEPIDFERAAVWRAIRPTPRRPAWFLPTSLVAALLVGALGVGLWTSGERHERQRLEQMVAQLTAPQPNAPIYHLVPTTRSSRPAQQGFPLAEEMQTFTLVFNLVAEDPEASFRAELLDAAGELALAVDDLQLDELGTLTLGLSRKSLPAGDYVVHLYSTTREDDSGEESPDPSELPPEASYSFRLEAL